MDKLLSKFYYKVLCEEQSHHKHGKRFDNEVTELVKPLYEKMDSRSVDDIRELICKASCSAEEYGFYLGIHTALKLMTEAVNILDEL